MPWLRGIWRRLTRPPEVLSEQLRIDRALVSALAIGAAALAVLGVVGLAYVEFPLSLIQPIGGVAASVWAMRMLYFNRPRPLLILGLGLALTLLGIIIEYWFEELPGEIGRSGAVTLVVATGVVAMTARSRRRAGAAWLLSLLFMGTVTSLGLGFGFANSLLDGLESMVVMGVAMYMVAANRQMLTVVDERYVRLAEAMVLGVTVVDLRGMRRALVDAGMNESSLEPLLSDRDIRHQVAGSVRVLTSNDAALTIATASSVEDAEQLLIAMLRSPRHDEMLVKMALTALTGSAAEYVTERPDGRAFLMRYFPEGGRSLRITVLTIEITAQRQAERALEEEIRSKDQFIASVSHELRTPLTAVMGLTEELRAGTSDLSEQERKELMDIVAEQTRDISAIVEDLLVAARAEIDEITIEAMRVDLVPLILQTVERLELNTRNELPAALEAVGDSARIRQIARNLLTNAERYGGNRVRLVGGHIGDSVWLEVRDNGEPIPATRRDQIFAAYQRAHQPIKGTPQSVGLGLTVSSTLADLMGGSLEYDHDGTEAVFRLTLPAA